MTKTSELGRLCMNAASNVAGAIADHYLKNMQLSGDNALRSFEYMARLAGATTGLEAIELSGAHYRRQLNVLDCYTGNLIALVCKMSSELVEPFKARALEPVVLSRPTENQLMSSSIRSRRD
jgi:hypothetical protein